MGTYIDEGWAIATIICLSITTFICCLWAGISSILLIAGMSKTFTRFAIRTPWLKHWLITEEFEAQFKIDEEVRKIKNEEKLLAAKNDYQRTRLELKNTPESIKNDYSNLENQKVE